MPGGVVNDTNLSWRDEGAGGGPVLLLHGSWQDHHAWDALTPRLARGLRVVAFDRRGHGASVPGRGRVGDDVRDAAALVERLGLAPAHLVGHSSGGSIALRLAAARPDLVRSVVAHEPPLLALLGDAGEAGALARRVRAGLAGVRALLDAGDAEGAAEHFVERVALGPGAWGLIPAAQRRRFVAHAATFAGELDDPDIETIDARPLPAGVPVLLTRGSTSPEFFAVIVERLRESLPHAAVRTLPGAGHAPHATHPAEFERLVRAAVAAHAAPGTAP